MKILLFSWLIILLGSCRSQDPKEKENIISSQEKQIKNLEERINKMESEKINNVRVEKSAANEPTASSSQYYFIVLDVEEHRMKNESFYYTTGINEIGSYNETLKYQLLDNAVSNYKKSPNGMAWGGTVKNRRIFLFKTYEDASKAREKYIMQ